MIGLLILLLATTSSLERNYNYLADYVKFNRIVFLTFILGGYLAYNTLDIYGLSNGIGIYGGVFKVTVLSQVFDIIIFMTGAIVSILTCFVPYNYKRYDEIESTNILVEKKLWNNYKFFNSKLKDYNNEILKKNYTSNISNKEGNNEKIDIYKSSNIMNFFKLIINKLPNININSPFLVEKTLNYSKLEIKEYNFLLLFTVLGGSLLISSQNLISLYLSLELQSFTLYILSTSQIRSFYGTSGGFKYFLLGGLSSGFILLGCSLLYAYTGTLNLEHIFMIYSDTRSNYIIDPCLLILLAGLLFKVSAAPFHNWAPDVYSDVPTNSTTWLIVIAKLSVLILMLVLVHNIHSGLNLNNLNILEQYYSVNNYKGNEENLLINDNITDINSIYLNTINNLYLNNNISFSIWNPSYSSLGLWTNILIFSAVLSLIIGTVLGISQSRTKRLFAYSTIAHVGFLLLALSLNSIVSIDAFLFYLIQYTISNLNLFFILIAWGYLYCRYYLKNDLIPVRYLSENINNNKDIYVEPTIYDFIESILSKDTELYHPNIKKKLETIDNYLLEQNYGNNKFKNEESEWIYTPVPFLTNLKGMQRTDPFLAFCLSVTIFSLMGIPPLIGFFAKQQVLLASMQLDYYFVSLIAILTSVIGAAYYLRIVKFIYFYDDVFMPHYMSVIGSENKEDNYDSLVKSEFILYSKENNNLLPMLPSNGLSLVIAVLTNITLFYVFKPYVLINVIYMMSIPLFQI